MNGLSATARPLRRRLDDAVFMMVKRRSIIRYIGLVALPVIFLAGLAQLFLLRFETGDGLPPYSSLRTDPLGTKALYESLDRIESVAVSRNYRPLAALDDEGARHHPVSGREVAAEC